MTPLERAFIGRRLPWPAQALVCGVLLVALVVLIPFAVVSALWHGLRGRD